MKLFLAAIAAVFIAFPAHALPVYVQLTFTSVDDGSVIGGASFDFDPEVKTLVRVYDGNGEISSAEWLALINNFEGNINGEKLNFGTPAGSHVGITNMYAKASLKWNEETQKKDGSVSWGALLENTRYEDMLIDYWWLNSGRYVLYPTLLSDNDLGPKTIANVSYEVTAVPLPPAGIFFGIVLPMLLAGKRGRLSLHKNTQRVMT